MSNDPPRVDAVHDLIAKRSSPRAFDPRPISAEELHALFEAARWAPSSFNEQPWRFIVAERTKQAEFAEMLACLMSGNRSWAEHASALIISVAAKTFAHNGKDNRHAFHDVGLAVSQLTLEATARGLVLHQMAGYDAARVRTTYDLPENFDSVAIIALGHPGDAANLPDNLRERESAPRVRKPLSELVFNGRWNRPQRGL